MKRALVFRRTAQKEFEQAGDWYEKERKGLGADFLAAMERALSTIAGHPEQFPIVHRDVRKAVVRRFPYNIYFRERGTRIVVLAVFHNARNPNIWQARG